MQGSAARRVMLNYEAIAGKVLKKPKGSRGAVKDQSRIANISGIAPVDDGLWTASDEEASLELLQRDDNGYARAQSWDLAELFPAFAAACTKATGDAAPSKKLEADLEGLAFDAQKRRLWMVGSHCRGRGSMANVETETLRAGIRRNLDRAPLRTLLGFVPLAADGTPAKNGGLALPMGAAPGGLRAAVHDDGGHLAEALKWPAKENGFDIEGIAVKDTEVLLGLRGPTVGGFAVVMRLSVRIGAKGLSLRKRKGASYFLSYLPLNGLGVRDLFRRGDDALVLAGPTMDLDAPFALYRWRRAFAATAAGDEKLDGGDKRLEFLFDFKPPERTVAGGRADPLERPEGIALTRDRRLLVIHDRPSPWRRKKAGTLIADLFALQTPKKSRRPPG
jgi:hypothetical protein